MANHKSAEKRARQSVRRNARNNSVKSAVRTWEKKLRAAVTSKDAKATEELLRTFVSKVGKAAAKGVLTTQTAARKVSRLSKFVSSHLSK